MAGGLAGRRRRAGAVIEAITVAVGSREAIARGLEGYACEPECGAIGGGESGCERIVFAARIGERLGGPGGETLEGFPIGLSGV